LRPDGGAFDNSAAMHRFAIGWMILFAACTQTAVDDAISVCQPLCRCTETLPGAQRDCTASCTRQFEQSPLGEACVACVVEHADRCSTLVDDCRLFCVQATPLPSFGGPL
jgi:hypothetical protein